MCGGVWGTALWRAAGLGVGVNLPTRPGLRRRPKLNNGTPPARPQTAAIGRCAPTPPSRIHTKEREREKNSLPAPVTRATLPSSEAEARPRGPGIALNRLVDGAAGVLTVPGILSEVMGAVLARLVPDELDGAGFFSLVSEGRGEEEK